MDQGRRPEHEGKALPGAKEKFMDVKGTIRTSYAQRHRERRRSLDLDARKMAMDLADIPGYGRRDSMTRPSGTTLVPDSPVESPSAAKRGATVNERRHRRARRFSVGAVPQDIAARLKEGQLRK
mmetsp:Transcript_28831/g.73895  ORF Transcript_28831/g.73895 Transcript_28831/m.73895 type:complete len:124 (+) Transcript_28831:1324-1695(+)